MQLKTSSPSLKSMNSLPEVEMELKELMPIIMEKLSAGQTVKFSPMGISMLPMLRQKIDSVVLSAPPAKLKKYDLPLYIRDNGKYILHRVIEAGDTYTCCGDNQFQMERGIRPDQIIAIVTGFYRDDKYISVEDPKYLRYCRFWDSSREIRHFKRRAEGWLRRHL